MTWLAPLISFVTDYRVKKGWRIDSVVAYHRYIQAENFLYDRVSQPLL